MKAAERIRLRLREELDARDISQRDLADALSRKGLEIWTQSRVGKILTGRVALCVDDVEAFANALGLDLVEVVRDRGREFCADLTPSQMKLITIVRDNGLEDSFIEILERKPRSPVAPGITRDPNRRRPGGPMNSERDPITGKARGTAEFKLSKRQLHIPNKRRTS